MTHKTQLQISAALLPPVVNCGLCFALHFNVNANAQKFEPDYFLHISLYSGGLFILNIVCIVICANLTFVMKKVNFANSVVITKTKERRRSESSISASLMGDDVSTMYMNPPSKTTNASSSMMDNLLCRVQNDDLVQPFVVREMKSTTTTTTNNNKNSILVSSPSKDDEEEEGGDGDDENEVVM